MPSFVLDASATLGFLFPDERSPSSVRLEERLATDGAIVPAIWPTEVCNVVLVAERRGRITPDVAAVCLTEIQRLLGGAIRVDPTTPALIAAQVALARKHKLTTYDAGYLELAARLGLPLATFDQRLRDAATSDQVTFLG